MTTPITIPARKGKAALVGKGQQIRVINTHGQQVVDTWAFNRDDVHEFMSMEHSRASLSSIFCRPGHSMVTNKRQPILTMVEDRSGGIHDTLIAACDRHRYRQLGCKEYHDNCTDNLHAAMRDIGMTAPETPSPWNLFMNIPVSGDNGLGWEPPVCKPGDWILLRAEMDLAIVFSACPQDMIPINGIGMKPTEAHFEIL